MASMMNFILSLSETQKQIILFLFVFCFFMFCFFIRQFARFNYGTMRRGGLLDLLADIPAQVVFGGQFEMFLKLVVSRNFGFIGMNAKDEMEFLRINEELKTRKFKKYQEILEVISEVDRVFGTPVCHLERVAGFYITDGQEKTLYANEFKRRFITLNQFTSYVVWSAFNGLFAVIVYYLYTNLG